ncbi:MAG: CYTH and CHAD domain-containing protein [Pseudomonadota bacterium]
MNAEVELKLSAAGEDLEALAERALRGKGSARRPKRLVSTYYDTPDRRLASKGLSLRVREVDGAFVQTVKAEAPGLARAEDEAAVGDQRPDLGRIGDAAMRSRIGAVFPEELAPVSVTDIVRRTVLVEQRDDLGRTSAVEVALDKGQLRASGQTEAVAEVELELKAGSPGAVFTMARAFVDAGATRLITRSKAARASDLAAGTAPPARRAARVELDRELPIGEALGRVLDNCFQQWWANHEAAFDGRNPEGVHQLRVAVRRLRSVLAVFGPLLAPSRLTWLKDEARAVMGALGQARDLDVFDTELLPPLLNVRPNDGALGRLRAVAADARAEAYEAVRTNLASARYTTFFLGFGDWVEARGWHADADAPTRAALGLPLAGFAGGVLEKRAKVVRKRGKRFADLPIETRHEVRKDLKKLRYAADFFRDLYDGERTKPYLKRLATLQDAFGHANDVAVAETLLHGLGATDDDHRLAEARGLVLGWYGHASTDTERELLKGWRAFSDATPFWREPSPC